MQRDQRKIQGLNWPKNGHISRKILLHRGTSLSAPLFAATWARMLAGHSSLGFAGLHLYSVPAYTAPGPVCHDITSGSNGGETATVGWDLASGFGSMILSSANTNL